MAREYLSINVLDAALKRIEYAYKNYPLVIVPFSGGKDSTVVLELCKIVANKLNKLPVIAAFNDPEILDPITENFILTYFDDHAVNLYWFCFPEKIETGFSCTSPFFLAWNEDREDNWLRKPPKKAITIKQFPEWKPIKYGAISTYFKRFSIEGILLKGTRAEESLLRLKAVNNRRPHCWINKHPENSCLYGANPIYDFALDDVWLAYKKFGWKYNKLYDLLELYGISYRKQRTHPPIGEHGIKDLAMYRDIFPGLYQKMTKEIEGVEAATRYADSFIYNSNAFVERPYDMKWQDVCYHSLSFQPEQIKVERETMIQDLIKKHHQTTDESIPDSKKHSTTGLSWRVLNKIALSGDKNHVIRSTLNFGHYEKDAFTF